MSPLNVQDFSKPDPAEVSENATSLPELPDLPPVELPSASFVVQLFVIPAVVVVVVIAVWLLFGKLAGGERDAMEYVRQIRSSSGSWRSAYELASLIQNDPKLASDPRLLGELTDLLAAELDKNADPRLTQYVALTLGAFQTLDAKLADGQSVDPLAPLVRALDPKFDTSTRIAAAASLAKQAARLQGKLDDLRVVEALAKTSASAAEAEVRQLAVFALGFCGGEASTLALKDRLQGDEDRYVRFNAAIALGRRGETVAAGTLREMLSAVDLERLVDLPNKDEKANKIEAIQLEALEAVGASSASGNPALALSLRTEVDALTHSGLVSVRTKAKEVLQKLQSAQGR